MNNCFTLFHSSSLDRILDNQRKLTWTVSAPASKIRKILEPAENEAEQEAVDGTDIPDEEKTSDEEEYIITVKGLNPGESMLWFE